jgi:hypothetical protein
VAENPFIGLITGIVAAFSAVIVGNALVRHHLEGLAPSARVGISGLLGLGLIGTLAFFVGLFSTGPVLPASVAILVIAAAYLGRGLMGGLKGQLPRHLHAKLLLLGIGLLLALRVPAALSPSLGWDWDTISHQLAMAKIWLLNGKVDYIPFMHQSNVPATANMLYMLVLPFGGQFAAKVLGVFFAVFAALAIGGLTEKRYGGNSGWWAALAIVSAPVLLWEVGTAYVDVFHGACFALSAILASLWLEHRERKAPLLFAAFFMAIALATKYTAIQSGGALGIAMSIVGMGVGLKGALLVGVVGLLLASPWYIRNMVNTGNPVYPFFYSVFKGRNWSEANAASYTREQQQDFGVGQIYDGMDYKGKDPTAIPGAIAALATLPDKQINQGAPFGAVGPAVLLGLLRWPFSGLKGRTAFEKVLIVTALITLVTWFFLTQQSRYIIGLILMVAPLIGGAIVKLRLRSLLMLAISLQAFYTLFLFSRMPLTISGPESLANSFEFYQETQLLNEIGKSEKVNVALYDEVRGYYLDVPYFWANPGHHTMLPYDKYSEPSQLIEGLRSLGVTHIVLSMGFLGEEESREIETAFFDPAYDDFRHTGDFRKLIILAHREKLVQEVAFFRYGNNDLKSLVLKID